MQLDGANNEPCWNKHTSNQPGRHLSKAW